MPTIKYKFIDWVDNGTVAEALASAATPKAVWYKVIIHDGYPKIQITDAKTVIEALRNTQSP